MSKPEIDRSGAHAFTSTGYARAAAMLPATQRTQYNSIEDKIYYRISTA